MAIGVNNGINIVLVEIEPIFKNLTIVSKFPSTRIERIGNARFKDSLVLTVFEIRINCKQP